MPTTLPRLALTETPEVARALEVAAGRWPGVPRARLAALVLADWAAGAGGQAARARALADFEGSMPGISGLYDRKADWPE